MLTKTFETPGPLALEVRVPAGSVDVEAREQGRTDVAVEPLDDEAAALLDEVRVELRPLGDGGHLLRVEVPERRGFLGFGRGPSFEVSVRCPPGARVDARGRSADLRVRGTVADLRVKTASGDVGADEVAGELELVGASGDVEVKRVHGGADVKTASGDVRLGDVGGVLRASLVSGDLVVGSVGAAVETNTVSGDQRLESVATGPVKVRSVSGDLAIAVSRGTAVWLDVRSVSGDTRSELDVGSEEPAEGEHVLELRASTVSGDIRIGRASSVPAMP